MGCIESLQYEILLRGVSFRECREYIRNHFKETLEVPPGFKIFDTHIIGVPPVAVGLDGEYVVFPYTKPCHGTFLLKVEDRTEAERLRRNKYK
jgi:hypothetical protein